MNVSEILAAVRATSKGDRYSENLYKWLRKHKALPLFVAYSPISHIDGGDLGPFNPGKTCAANLYVGYGQIDDGFLFGSRLSEILCEGAKTSTWAHGPARKFQVLPNWLEEYAKAGKCFIDPEHRLYADRERWQESENGQRRTCAWCGQHKQYLQTKVILRHDWRSF